MLAMGSAACEIGSTDNDADNEATDMDREVDAGERCSWREVDRNLRAMAKNRAMLDAQEAPWLRLVEELRIWRHVGMVSAIDYLERVLGYEPRTAQERLRVARALGNLPLIASGLEDGDLQYSAVRALTRVATPATEQRWRDAAIGKTVREVYELADGHAPGSDPEDPANPELKKRIERFELDPATYALLRQARQALDEEHGRHLDDSELIAALCAAVLDGAGADRDGRAKYQVALTVCARCKQGWQDGAGAVIPVDAATVARADCDAQMIGSIDGDSPERASQTVPPSVARFVWRRDHGRCQTPGCRSTRGIEIHHIIARADGGSHEPSNLTLRCSACHISAHRGLLTISGTAPDQIIVHRVREPRPVRTTSSANNATTLDDAASISENTGTALDDATASTSPGPSTSGSAAPSRFEPGAKLALATVRAQVRDAMIAMQWKPAIVRAAIDAACVHVDAPVTFDWLIRQALRRCPIPT